MQLCLSGDGISIEIVAEAVKIKLKSNGCLDKRIPAPDIMAEGCKQVGTEEMDKAVLAQL